MKLLNPTQKISNASTLDGQETVVSREQSTLERQLILWKSRIQQEKKRTTVGKLDASSLLSWFVILCTHFDAFQTLDPKFRKMCFATNILG
mmetsp:Transcript_12620/g.18578  ORF Transcript_12620/g.18578 Transcript_12620/m.18578 type:complete len:91 (-) Transcript_12620:218-490(-)